jgi:hypothetical protein
MCRISSARRAASACLFPHTCGCAGTNVMRSVLGARLSATPVDAPSVACQLGGRPRVSTLRAGMHRQRSLVCSRSSGLHPAVGMHRRQAYPNGRPSSLSLTRGDAPARIIIVDVDVRRLSSPLRVSARDAPFLDELSPGARKVFPLRPARAGCVDAAPAVQQPKRTLLRGDAPTSVIAIWLIARSLPERGMLPLRGATQRRAPQLYPTHGHRARCRARG